MSAAGSGIKFPHYIKGAVLAVDEDGSNEFKAHADIAVEEVSPWSQEHKTKKPTSRNINAFLNTGNGGTIYLGVTDDGVIKGLRLTPFQKDHIYSAVWETLERYKPPVPKHRVVISFIAALDREPSQEELQKIYSAHLSGVPAEYRCKAHCIRSYTPCWCDTDAILQAKHGIIHPDFVVHITVKPWNASDPRDAQEVNTCTKLHPIYANEEGMAFIRRQASVAPCDLNFIYDLSKKEVEDYYRSRRTQSVVKYRMEVQPPDSVKLQK